MDFAHQVENLLLGQYDCFQPGGRAVGQRVAVVAVVVFGEDCTEFFKELPIDKTIVVHFNVTNRFKDNNNSAEKS